MTKLQVRECNMDFRQAIRNFVGKDKRGIEIGPSYSPILPKSAGHRVYSIDHADQASLREKYRNDPNVDISKIEVVDAVDDGQEFFFLDEKRVGFDFVASSHVFEHLPNPIAFLQRCERALKENGRVFIIVPDRRFCFDVLRPVSTTGQMIQSYLQNRRTHSAAALFDHNAYNGRKNGNFIWSDREAGTLSLTGNPVAGYAAAVTAESDSYSDCHGWVFTPSSLRLILEDLRGLGLIGLGEAAFHDTVGPEFMIELSRGAASHALDRTELAVKAVAEAQEIPIGSSAIVSGYKGYERAPAAPQNGVRLLDPSWVAALPPELGIKAGDTQLFADPRIEWLIGQVGAAWRGIDVLELGPLEASHTVMMTKAGAGSVLAIEANRLAYLKCLVVKETLGLDKARFLLGDFVSFLQSDARRWPLIVGSGVLYHMVRPLELLRAVAARTDRVFLWTHVYDEASFGEGDSRRASFERTEIVEFEGTQFHMHVRPYGDVENNPKFCGGPIEGPRYMERKELLEALRLLGFDDIRIDSDNPDHPSGPALSIYAQRRAPA